MPDDGRGNRLSDLVDLTRLPLTRLGRAVAWLGARPALVWCGRMIGKGVGAVGRLPAALAHGARAFPDWVDHLRRVTTGVALVGGIGIGTWIIVDLSHNEPLVFEPINVHPELEKLLPKGDRLANRISAHFEHLTAAIERLRDKQDSALKPDTELPKLEIPGAQVSVQAAVEILRRFFGLRERRIGGDVFLTATALAPPASAAPAPVAPGCTNGRQAYVVVRLSANRGELADAAEWPVCVAKSADGKTESVTIDAHVIEALLQLAALRAYERVNPCGSAAYYFHNWYRRSLDGRYLDGDFRRANMLISHCLLASGDGEAPQAYHLLGRIRLALGQSAEAVRYFEAAEGLHRRSGRSGALRNLYGDWGSALLGTSKPAKAMEKFFEQIRREPKSALGYIGMGNAVKVLAHGGAALSDKKNLDQPKLAAALYVYCQGALKNRFDAEIRHVLADFLEEYHGFVGRCPERTPNTDENSFAQRRKELIKGIGEARAYALEQRQKTVDLMPSEPKYGLAYGRLLRVAGDDQGAIAAFNHVLGFSQQQNWEAYAELVATYRFLKRDASVKETYRQARDVFGRAALQRPFDAEVRYHAALAHLALNEAKEAATRAVEAKALDPDLWRARLALACAMWRDGSIDEARAELATERALERDANWQESIDPVLVACIHEIERRAASKPE